jgi:deoxyribose-phosphate aldolase
MIQFAHAELAKDFAARDSVLKSANQLEGLAALIDSTLLKPDTKTQKIAELCFEAGLFHFRTVCVPPAFVSFAKQTLHERGAEKVSVCTVISFPNGYATTETKEAEIGHVISQGADEIDFVQNVTLVKDKNWQSFENECGRILLAAKGKLVKIILETSLLTTEEIYESALRAALCGVPVIKTSTGFGARGATLEDIQTISKALLVAKEKTGKEFGIKASGGVRSLQDALGFMQAGATRLGTSSGAIILQGLRGQAEY